MSGCPFADFTNMIDPDTYANGMPYDELARIRASGPIHWMEDPTRGVPYWLVTGRNEIDFISKHPKEFSSQERTALADEYAQDDIDAIHSNMTINMDPPRQMKSRKVVRPSFTPAAVNSYADRFRDLAREIVDKVASRGECEFVEEVAAELPLLAILELCGIPAEDRKDFFQWTNAMIFNQDSEMSADKSVAEDASFKVIEYAMKLAAEHAENPKDNIIGALLDGNGKDPGLDMDEFVWFFLMLISAGNESTRTVTSHAMRLLMDNPDQLQYLVDNPDKIPNACEEVLRYNTAFILMRRTAMEDMEVGGQQIKKGDKIIMHYHTVNHDESVFGEDAMKFDVKRAERMPDLYNQHRAFGIGQHFCLGSHLARLELVVMMEEIIPRIRNPKLMEELEYTRSDLVNGIKRMYITFDPEVKDKAQSAA
ncbi:cytochrome P450 [Halieaceae bacterium IMCC14734]|uniref:Cytochrome P450 n=1 Tax=Candidatus Litorirhabdus singularis TaxID=2518993 RepID=A0ABT3THZ3_9GAMM|nr:cytochrome P450 [Candidatus Litorirhabdus singularis]MCX2981002.1 cytochrome P450 [Candidatus Litorirhabdus singularis]